MINPALSIIEMIYEMGLNPTQPYYAQLEPLAASGELANKVKTSQVLFRLCELVDKQTKEIKMLQDDREEIAKRMLILDEKLKPIDPTQPLDDQASNRTQPIANTAV